MPRIILNRQRLPIPIRINQLRDNEAAVVDALRLGHGQRVALDGLDRAPDVDDLHAGPEQPVRVLGQVVRDPG